MKDISKNKSNQNLSCSKSSAALQASERDISDSKNSQMKKYGAEIPPKPQSFQKRGGSEQKQQSTLTTFENFMDDSNSQSKYKIQYKLMEKTDILSYKQEDFELIEEAILNLESLIPQQQSNRRSKSQPSFVAHNAIITQRQLVEALEIVILNKKHYNQAPCNHLFRLTLKIHHKFEQLLETQAFSIGQQFEILIEYLNIEIQNIQQQIQAQQSSAKCIMQKAFLSLLENMAQLSQSGRSSNSRYSSSKKSCQNTDIHKNMGSSSKRGEPYNQRQNTQSQFGINSESQRPKSILKAPSLSKSPGKGRLGNSSIMSGEGQIFSPNRQSIISVNENQSSPAEKKLIRQLQKNDSPVRKFLDEENQKSKDSQQFQIHQIQQTSQEDSVNLNQKYLNYHVPKKIYDSQMFTEKQQINSQENFKMLLKCMRIWKIFIKSEILRREQAKLLDVQKIQQIQSDIESEIDLQQERENQKTIYAIAMNHYENNLAARCLQALFENIYIKKNEISIIRDALNDVKGRRQLYDCFQKWHLVILKLQKLKSTYIKYKNFYVCKLAKYFIRTMKKILMIKNQKAIKYLLVKKWNLKKKILKKVFLQLIVDSREKDRKCSQFLTEQNSLKRRYFNKLKSCGVQQEQILIKNHMEKSRKLKMKFFQNWLSIVNKNYQRRVEISKGKLIKNKFLKKLVLKEWLILYREVLICKKYFRIKLKKKVLNSIVAFIDKSQRKQNILKACTQHLEIIKTKHIMKSWRVYIENQQKYRFFQLHVYNKIDQFKLRNIYKSWYNQIDILKKWRSLNENTYQWLQNKIMKRIFEAWHRQIKLKILFFKVNDKHRQILAVDTWKKMAYLSKLMNAERYIQIKRIKHLKKRTLYFLYNNIGQQRIKFFQFHKNIKKNILKNSFNEMKIYLCKKIRFKKGMRRFLKFRANNLLRKAYIFGLKIFWRDKQIHKNMKQVSILIRNQQLLKKCFKALSKKLIARQKGQRCKRNYYEFVKKQKFSIWLSKYTKKASQTKFRQRGAKKLVSKVFQALKSNQIQDNLLILKQKKFITNKSLQTVGKVWEVLENYKIDQVQKKCKRNIINNSIWIPYLRKQTFRNWAENVVKMKNKKKLIQELAQLNLIKILKKIFNIFKKKFGSKAMKQAMIENKVKQFKSQVFCELYRHSNSKLKQKQFQQIMRLNFKKVIYNGIYRYYQYRQYFNEKEQDLIDRVSQIKKKVCLNKLKCFKLQKQFDDARAKVIQQNLCKKYMRRWKNLFLEFLEEGEQRHQAIELFQRNMFNKLKINCQNNKEKRHLKKDLLRKQTLFHNYCSKRRAIKKINSFFDKACQNKVYKINTLKIQCKKFFKLWRISIDIFIRKRLLKESAEQARSQYLLTKGLRSLQEYNNQKMQENLLINKFRERAKLSIKAEILLSLFNHINSRKIQCTLFYKKMVFIAEKTMAGPFKRWQTFVDDKKMLEKADKFFKQRSAQFITRTAWDCLKIFKATSNEGNLQTAAINAWHGKLLQQKTLMGLKILTQKQKRIENIINIMQLKTDRKLLQQYLQYLKNGTEIRKEAKYLQKKAMKFYINRTLRKCLKSLRITNYKRQRNEVIFDKACKRIEKEWFTEWYKLAIRKIKIKKIFSILQQQNYGRIVHQFFPALIKISFHAQIVCHFTQKREVLYKSLLIDVISKKIIMKKILKQFILKKQLETKKEVLIALRLNEIKKQNLQQVIDSRIENIDDKINTDLLQISFNSLKERVVRKRFKNISQNCFIIKTLRACFYALERHNLKRKILRNKVEEIRKIQEARYLYQWRKIFIKEREKQDASGYMQQTVLYQYMTAWRNYSFKNSLARKFNQNITKRNIVCNVLQEWRKAIQYEKQIQSISLTVQELCKRQTEKKFIYNWLGQVHTVSIYRQMGKIGNLKVQASIFQQWKQIKDKNNHKRFCIHKIRQHLTQKPQLARPLKVMKNFLLFKAFNKLFEGARLVFEEDENTDQAHFAYYMKLTKTTFYSLKLNSQLCYLDQQSTQIADLFLKRRWLQYIRIGVSYLKERRKIRHKASIFRFLSLQKKALQILERYAVLSQELKIKKEFATKLYYKRLLDLAFASLQAYTNDKKETRSERRRMQETQEENHLEDGTLTINQVLIPPPPPKYIQTPSIISQQRNLFIQEYNEDDEQNVNSPKFQKGYLNQ